jgi:phosphoribosylanthranilate isomerase
MIKYIDNEEIVKITYIIDNVKTDDVQYHITDRELISSLNNYFHNINITRTLSIPRFKNENSLLIFIYDKSGKVATISTQTSLNGELYFYIQSNIWYKVKEYNSSYSISKDILDIINN